MAKVVLPPSQVPELDALISGLATALWRRRQCRLGSDRRCGRPACGAAAARLARSVPAGRCRVSPHRAAAGDCTHRAGERRIRSTRQAGVKRGNSRCGNPALYVGPESFYRRHGDSIQARQKLHQRTYPIREHLVAFDSRNYATLINMDIQSARQFPIRHAALLARAQIARLPDCRKKLIPIYKCPTIGNAAARKHNCLCRINIVWRFSAFCLYSCAIFLYQTWSLLVLNSSFSILDSSFSILYFEVVGSCAACGESSCAMK